MVGTATQQRHEEQVGVVPREWGIIRIVLLAALGVLLVGAALTAVRPASMDDLHNALRSGEVTQVHLVGDLPPPMTGTEDVDFSYAKVLWNDGFLDRYTSTPAASELRPTRGAADELRAGLNAAAAGELSITSQPFNEQSQGYIYYWQVASWVSVMMMVLVLVGLVTLFASPTPRLATRWAWFWLAVGSAGVALLAYPLLGLPRAGQPLRPTGRRLTGGWAFLIAVLLLSPMT